METTTLAYLRDTRYVSLRSFRRDGTPIDTPIWFDIHRNGLVFRTGVGPKTQRLARRPEVELIACDYRGRVAPGATPVTGRASFLSGAEAELANRMLHQRYGWQWNIVPLIKVPGVTNVTGDLSIREKLRRARCRTVWPDFVIVRVDLDV